MEKQPDETTFCTWCGRCRLGAAQRSCLTCGMPLGGGKCNICVQPARDETELPNVLS